MTVLAAVVEPGGAVVIGSDAAGSGTTAVGLRSRSTSVDVVELAVMPAAVKVHRLHDANGRPVALVAAAASYLLLNVVADLDGRMPSLPGEGADVERWLRREWLPLLRSAATEAGAVNKEGKLGGYGVVGVLGRLLAFDPDFAVRPVPAWGDAYGAGALPARGALWATRDHPDGAHRVQVALEAAEAVVATCRGPWRIERLPGPGAAAFQ